MSIRILPDSEIQQAASSFHNPPLLYANPKNLYARRAKRLRQLAENHPFGDYLKFVANIVEVQLDLLESQPLAKSPQKMTACLSANQGVKPLNSKTFQRSDAWQALLLALISKFKPYANESVLTALEWLEKAAKSELDTLADDLLNERFDKVSADKAVFVWAALSLYWVQLTQQLPRQTQTEVGERHTCPVCDSAPITSVVHFGETQGLRYLHCSLCETEWHVVRAKCSNCNQAGQLDYWHLDINEAVKTESCGDCESYLKILYQEKDPYVEPVADDLATIFLDAEMEKNNFLRSGINPFLFRGCPR
ncbi:formate dehydrogenase accessory protein FdhE [Pasteurellaceae bacterium Macca]|nr:formate dehydrogenase accessory protein FdhE [Pasteurellaceae bacterium Macca]